MASKRKSKAAPEIVREYTPAKDLKALLSKCRSTGEQVGEINGALREKIAYAVDKKFLHAKAFRIVRMLDKMEPENLAEFFAHFDNYCTAVGLRDRAESAPALELEESPSDDEKVSRPKFGERAEAEAVG